MIAAALMSAVIGLVINPDVLGGLLRAVTGGDDTAELVERQDAEGVFTFVSPKHWGVARASFDEPGPSGMAVVTAADVTASVMSSNRFYMAASRGQVTHLGLTDGADPMTVFRAQLVYDWSADGCRFVGERPLQTDHLNGLLIHHQGCHGLDSTQLWNGIAVTADGRAVVFVQLVLDDASEKTAVHMLESVTVHTAALPS